MKYSYNAMTSPWDNWEDGIMFQYYDTHDACYDDLYNDPNFKTFGGFYYVKLDTCIPTSNNNNDDGEDNGGIKFISCGGNDNEYNMTMYYDIECKNEIQTLSNPMEVCVANEPTSDDLNTNNFRTMSCPGSDSK